MREPPPAGVWVARREMTSEQLDRSAPAGGPLAVEAAKALSELELSVSLDSFANLAFSRPPGTRAVLRASLEVAFEYEDPDVP